MGLLEQIERTRFLGEEFLTWLWFRSETEPSFDLGPHGKLRLDIADPMVLRGSSEQDAYQLTLKGERSSISAEALSGLREGKKLCKCKALLKQEDRVWPVTLSADTLAIGSLGLPVPKGAPMPDQLILRAERLEEFSQILFTLYEQFLGLRLREDKWTPIEKAIRKWARE